jgi:DNA replication protein DnaC
MTHTENIDLDRLLKRLNLANARRVWRDLVVRAEAEQWSFQRFLDILVAEEVAQRSHTRLARLSHRARFPFLKTIEDFDFTYQSTVRLALLGSALSPDFVTEGRSLILLGKPGRGKTHLAVAIAYRAIQNGFEALFVTAAELIDDLSGAFRNGRLAEALALYTHPHLLVIDEVGYLTYGTDAANMLFHVVNDRHKRKRSMIFTTNKALSAWGRVLHDEDLAQAIVDRVLERGRLLHLDGPSIRTKHLGLDDPTATEAPSTELVRISGIPCSEFPEPTRANVDEHGAHDDGTEHAVEQHSFLELCGHREEVEKGNPHEDVVHGERLLDEVAGEVFQCLFVGHLSSEAPVEVPPEPTAEDERDRDPHHRPRRSLLHGHPVGALGLEHEKVHCQQDDDEQRETEVENRGAGRFDNHPLLPGSALPSSR